MTTFQLQTKRSVEKTLHALADAIESRDATAAQESIMSLDWEDQRRAMSRLSDERCEILIHLLGAEDGATLLSHLAEAQVVEIIEGLPTTDAAELLELLPPEKKRHSPP